MKNFFLDTNVIIDFLANRQPFSIDAAKLFNSTLSGNVNVFISAFSYSNIYYILRQSMPNNEAIKILNDLCELTEIADVTKEVIQQSLHSDFKDFEDAIQHYCALNQKKIDCIVTRNTKDFKQSILPVMTPKEALSLIKT
jgi:predicted nucleic acid-binding protein